MKIIKASKRITPPHPEITELVDTVLETPTNDLPTLIADIPEWRWPRSDLGNWIKVLNKFDVVLQDIITEYDIDNLQLKELTPLAKSTVLEVLRFERMLLENSTSRKLYSSYDRLNSLLFSSDLDVVLASLKVILRPSQQYSAQPPSSHTTNISSARLLSLAQSWTALREQGVELHDFLDKKKSHISLELTGESGDANLQFYRKSSDNAEAAVTSAEPSTAPASAPVILSDNAQHDASGSSSQALPQQTPNTSTKQPTTGLTSVHVPGVAASPKNSMVIVAETHEKNDLPVQERFDLLCKVRIIKAMGKGNEVDRSKLAAIKLLAIAIYAHTHSESQAMTTLFLYDPELVNHVAELIHPDRDIDQVVQIAALVALDGLGRYRTKVLEVLGAVNAGVSHGILLSQLRRTAVQLGDANSGITNEFAEALLSLFILLISSQGAGNMIVGAGMIPLLVQIIETKTPSRLPVISKTMVLLDSALYGFAAAFQVFCNNRGVDAVVERIEHEVDYNIAELQDKTDVTPAVLNYGRLAYARSSVLKHLLRSMHRMMQASGASEGLRTLIDSSLPKSIKKIMENRVTFGPPIFSISINLMSIFVHNEPTSLAILQEQRLPETFFDAIEAGIEPALEVMNAIPNAIGALCLNATGEAEFAARTQIIPSIFATFTSEKHLKALGDKDNAVMIGTAIDELIRHHPSLKARIFEGVQSMLSKIEEMGKAWIPPKGEEKHYMLSPPAAPVEEPSVVDMDTEPSPPVMTGGEPIATGDEPAKEEGSSPKAPENVILSFIDVAVKLLEGLFQHMPHCRDFILVYDGVESLGKLLNLPCLPIHFSETPAADSLIQAFRTMAELAPKETLTRLSTLARVSLDATNGFWDTTTIESRFSQFINIPASEDINSLNSEFRKLVTLQITVGLLADVYQTAGYSHVRSVTTILQILTGAEAPEIIDDLGKLHRRFFWESTILKNTLSLSTSPEKSANSVAAESPSSEPLAGIPDVVTEQVQTEIEGTAAEGSSTQPASSVEEDNRKALKFIVGQIPTALTPFFQAIVKMFMSSRRNSEPPLKALAANLADRVAKVMVEHCKWMPTDDSKSFFAYESLVISLISVLFCDERSAQNTLHTLLLLVFYRAGGVDAVLEVGQRCFDSVDQVVKVPRQERTAAQETELAYAFGAMNVVVHLLHLLVSSKPILDSNQTSTLVTRDKNKSDPLYFEPHDFLVRMRLISFPLIRDVWKALWLSNAPLITLRSAINTVVEIMAAEHENTPPSTPSEHVHVIGGSVPQPRPGPDEATVTQLADMGFTRAAAERALARTRNNINGAAELLLTHPYLFANVDEPALVVPPPVEAPASAEGSVVGDQPPVVEPAVPDPNSMEAVDSTTSAEPAPVVAVESTPAAPPRDWADELKKAREMMKGEVTRKALLLLDEHPGLVFEAKTAFMRLGEAEKDSDLRAILRAADDQKGATSDLKDEKLSARCRLLALILNDATFYSWKLPPEKAEGLMELVTNILRQVPSDGLTASTLPKWLAPIMLVAEALLMIGEAATSVKIPAQEEEIIDEPLFLGPRHNDARSLMFDICLRMLPLGTLPRDDMLSTLRLLILLTRERKFCDMLVANNGIPLLMDRFKSSSKDILAYRPHVFMVLRHVIEDIPVLQSLMQYHIRRYFQSARSRIVDVQSYVRSSTPMVMRDPEAFLAVSKSTCRLLPTRTGLSYNVTIKDADQGTKSSGSTTEGMQLDLPKEPSSSLAETLVHHLLNELIHIQHPTKPGPTGPAAPTPSAQPESQGPAITPIGDQEPTAENNSEYVYGCVLMQCLSELLSSYNSCKLAFVSFHKKRSVTGGKDHVGRHRTTVLNILLSEILSANDGAINPETQKKVSLATWATSVIVSLCTDVYWNSAAKEPSEDIVTVRKFVLDAIAKSIKDATASESPEMRYSKLHALSDLCFRLLSSRAAPPTTNKDDPTIHIAKTMLEKNFVSILTSALADADLNFPGMKSLVGTVMRPLEHLTKVAIKMGRAAGKPKDGTVGVTDNESITSSEGSDAMESERDDTPDLYRNSALGMFGGDMEDVEYNDEDDEDMDEDDDEDDDGEMDYGEDDSSGTESSEDEDGHDEVQIDGPGQEAVAEDEWDNEVDGMVQDDGDGTEDEEHSEDEVVGEADGMVWDGEEIDDVVNDAINIQGGGGDIMDEVAEDDEEVDPDAAAEDEDFIDPGLLELPDTGGLDEMGWDAGDMPWNPIPGDFGLARHPHIFPPSRRRLGDVHPYNAFPSPRRMAPQIDPTAHPLLIENQAQVPPDASLPVLRPSSRRPAHGNIIAAGADYNDLVQTINQLVGGHGAQLLQELVRHGMDPGSEAVRLQVTADGDFMVDTVERSGQHHHHHHFASSGHVHRSDRRSRTPATSDAALFSFQTTVQRWAEEAKLMQTRVASERVSKLVNHIIVALLPASREAAKIAKEEAERMAAEAEKKRLEDESKAVAETVQQEEEQKVEEEQLAMQPEQEETEGDRTTGTADEDVIMSDPTPDTLEAPANDTVLQPESEVVVGTSTENDQVAESSTATADVARVTVLVHGNMVDITDTGIDPTFLEALPDDMREEIINQHFRERRTNAQVERPADSQISPEFLDALPPDIRAEILQQETLDQARRQRASHTGPTGPSDIDPASFLASLDPQLRQAVLLEQDDGFLQTLPSSMIAEANGVRELATRAALHRPIGTSVPVPIPAQKKPAPHRDAVQLVDKAGVSTLVRLLFSPQAHKRSSLHKVLINLCENSKTRGEILNLLLTILQSGTADLSAVDKSFSQMSMRANRAPNPRTTPRPKASGDSAMPFLNPGTENIPNLVAQRCLEALGSLIHANEQCSVYFLSEHELPAGLKRGVSKKGKGKEKQASQTHFPLVLLLGLLDKPTILKTPSVMDLVAALLASVTKPLVALKDEGSTRDIAVSSVPNPASTTSNPPVSGTTVELSQEGTQVPLPTEAEPKPPKAEEPSSKLLTVPPQVPHSVLRLIVNILTVGECSARTFQHTLSMISHLSHLPDARDTIASELKSKAQEFGHTIYQDLDSLAVALEVSVGSDSVPGSIMSRFSPASSDQAKLLRVLKTIDFMFTKKTDLPPAPGTSLATDIGMVLPSDDEKAQAIYEAFRFNSLWNRLGDCLAIVAERPDMEHVTTVLLPLIESLMVVCKYVSPAGSHRRALLASASPRSPTTPRESAEDLFVSFTDAHRKMLNSMVRNNPSLMSGSFSLLVNNPRVLDFDNKRNYFTQKLRRRPNRESYGTLQVTVRRQRVFEDSFQVLQRQTADQIKYGKLNVRFYDEEGVDAGGVTREWFQILARQMFNPDYALFQPCAADKLTYQPNQASYINSEHLAFFKFVGRIIGKAIYDGRLMDAYFARSLYRQMLGKPVDYRDVEWVDPEYYSSLCWILENDPAVLDLTFSVEANAFGETRQIALKEGGHSIPVTNENKREYVQLSAEYRLVSSIKDQIQAFLAGFYDIIPKDLIAIFNEQELELLISGTPDIDVDEWRAATDYTGYSPADPVIVWWWRALKSFTRDERAKVLSFATGTSKVPLGGFVDLQGVHGVQRFSIHKAYGEADRLPQAHTCFNQIDLPQYTSYDKMRTQLLLAINEGGEGFGFA